MIEILFCLIIKITDGDTVTARCGIPAKYKDVKVRVAAIDTPERDQPFGTEATEVMTAVCLNAKAKITIRQKRDNRKRVVADIECNGVDIGTNLVSNGLAWVYPQYAKKHKHLYPLQEEAKQSKRGLWSSKAIEPWVWRKLNR